MCSLPASTRYCCRSPRVFSNQEIADSLFMSPATAKTHVSPSLTKLDARDRVQLVVMAYESGLVGDRR